MRRLFWFLLAGCSSTGNSAQSFPVDQVKDFAPPAPSTCIDGPLTDFSYCPANYLPATDGPEQICRPWDAGFRAGTIDGHGYLDNDGRGPGHVYCTYDASSGALVGFYFIDGGFSCWGGYSAIGDAREYSSLSWIPCSGDGTGAPLVSLKR